MRLNSYFALVLIAFLVDGCGKSRAVLDAEEAALAARVRATVAQDEEQAREARAAAIAKAQEDFDAREQAARAEAAQSTVGLTVPVPIGDPALTTPDVAAK